MKRSYQLIVICVFGLFASACGASSEELEDAATAAVAAYQEAEAVVPTATTPPTATPYPTHTPAPSSTPLPTYTPAPTFTPLPTLTPVTADAVDLYCEFDFCMRHPQDPLASMPDYAMDYFDEVIDESNNLEEGGYTWLLEGNEVFVWLTWYVTIGDSPTDRVAWQLDDPNFSDISEIEEIAINNIDVAYASYTEVDSMYPYNLYAVWLCGPRQFRYSIRSKVDFDLLPHLESAVAGFVCAEGA